MAILFGANDVKIENKKPIITISDTTNEDRQNQNIEIISSDNEDEVMSPPARKKLNFANNEEDDPGMDIDDETSTNKSLPPGRFSNLPPRSAFPLRFRMSKSKGKAPSGSSSCASSSPLN